MNLSDANGTDVTWGPLEDHRLDQLLKRIDAWKMERYPESENGSDGERIEVLS